MRWSSPIPIVVLAVVAWVGPAAAQVIEVPPFEVAEPLVEKYVGDNDVAVGADGNLVVLYTEWKPGSPNSTKAFTALLAPDGTSLRAPVRVDTAQHVRSIHLASDTRGAYVAAFELIDDRAFLYGRLLAADGSGLGAPFDVGDPQISIVMPSSVAGTSSGSVFVWERNLDQLFGRLYDEHGVPRTGSFAISEPNGAFGFAIDTDAMPDGGFVAAWTKDDAAPYTLARVYRADGQPRGPILTVDDAYLGDLRVAASPTGGFAVVGTRWDGADGYPLWVRRLTDDGALLWESMVDQPPAGVVDRPDLAFDVLGNSYVAWGSYGGDGSYHHRARARGLDAGGQPLGGVVELDDFYGDTNRVRVARTANGTSFATVWNWAGLHIKGTLVALCGPGSTVCGDGDVAPHCEQCDDGPSNDDTTPDACRTDCRRAHCGDGTLDSAEECDDGNVLACDGCSPICKLETGHVCGDGELDPTCNEECDNGAANGDVADACRTTCRLPRCADGIVDSNEECDDGNFVGCDGCSPSCRVETGLVCGDGVAEAGCGESCDDGNLTSRDGCSAACVAERIPGGGKAATDCYAEWSVRNADNLPYFDKNGAISGQQACTDDDPSCDLDGGTPGACTFAIRVCGDNTDLDGCVAPLRLRSWELRSPSLSKADHDPTAAAIRAALATVPGTIVGPSSRDVCSEPAAVTVRLRGNPGAYKSTKLKLKSRAAAYDGTVDNDALTLICRPAP